MDIPEAPDLTGLITRLGSAPVATGGYSSVWRGSLYCASRPNDSERCLQVAIKVLRASHTDEHTAQRKLHKRLHTEMRVWTRLDHKNVVTLLGHVQEPEGPGLVSIWYPHGSILSYLTNNAGINREVLCADVALGLQYLHEHEPRIIHGDLKGANVLIDSEGKACITDFGLSIMLDGAPTGHTSSNFGGSLRFLAPELLEESIRTVQTDIYAYACTCIEILFDQEPYHQLSKQAHIILAMIDHTPPFKPPNESVTFPLFLQLLQRCWQHDPQSRPLLSLIIGTIQCCLYRTYRANLTVHQGIGKRLRLMALPVHEQEVTLSSVANDGLSIDVYCSTLFCRLPIYQRYRWEWMNTNILALDSKNSDVSCSREAHSHQSILASSSSLLGEDASSSSEIPPHISEWGDYSAKFRLPYSFRVSYMPYNKPASQTPDCTSPFLEPRESSASEADTPSIRVSSGLQIIRPNFEAPLSIGPSSSSPQHSHPLLRPGALGRSIDKGHHVTRRTLSPLVIPLSSPSSISKDNTGRSSKFYLPSPTSPSTNEVTRRPAVSQPQQHHPSRNHSLPWYLQPSWAASEVLLDSNGHLNAGTVRSLVEGLTMNEPNVPRDVFLLTYPSFASAAFIVDLLTERYEMGEPLELSDNEFEEWKTRKLWPVQTNVLNVFSSWLKEYHMVELEPTVVVEVKKFLRLIKSHPKNETIAKRLLQAIDMMMDDGHYLPSPVSPIKTKKSYMNIWRRPQKVDTINLDATEVAQQLTIMEYRLYNEIRPSELLTWSKYQDQSNPAVKHLTHFLHFNMRIVKFVAFSILSASELQRRRDTIVHFLEIAEGCRDLGNFAAVESIIAGMGLSHFEELESTEIHVEPRLEELRTLVGADTNYSGLRAAYQTFRGSCVPFIEMYLPWLVDIHQQFPDTIPMESGSHRSTLIDFTKRQRLAEVCKQALRFQGMPYSNLIHNPELAGILEDKLDVASQGDEKWR